jgi:hypothetical protein
MHSENNSRDIKIARAALLRVAKLDLYFTLKQRIMHLEFQQS